jgi:hypothetical protein
MRGVSTSARIADWLRQIVFNIDQMDAEHSASPLSSQVMSYVELEDQACADTNARKVISS